MNKLEEICARKYEHIAQCKQRISEPALLEQAKSNSTCRGFANALRNKIHNGGIGLIAEIKKASPSKGLIREDFSPPALARAYESGGAACISVLTDIPYFQGDDNYLPTARNACTLPILRKDFVLDTYQITESRALGADCILLIMAALSDTQAQELEAAAQELGMDVLIEAHDASELDRALQHLVSPLIGINNRNLKTLTVDLATSESLAPNIPDTHIRICESGIFTHSDIARMQAVGISCFLVGESLMRQQDVTAATRTLLGTAQHDTIS